MYKKIPQTTFWDIFKNCKGNYVIDQKRNVLYDEKVFVITTVFQKVFIMI
jgi:hypothetical protein